MSRDDDFATFVAQESGRLVAFATYVCGDPDLARDTVHDVLVRAYPKWGRVGADPLPYLRRSVVNAHRSRGRRPLRMVFGEVPERPVPPGQDAFAVRHVIDRVLDGLPPQERAIVVLRYFEDLTERQVADELGVPLGTVKSSCHRALARLRADEDVRSLHHATTEA